MTERQKTPEGGADYAPREHAHEGRILQIAARGMDVNVGPEEVEFWRMASQTAAALDTLVDEEGWRDMSPIFDKVISDNPQGIDGVITDSEATQLAAFYSGLSSERQEAWHAAMYNLPMYADYKAEAPNINRLVTVTFDEARGVFAKAFEIDSKGKPDEIPRERFNRWLSHFACAGYAIDAALDMPRDYETGVIRVEPTIVNRAKLLYAARGDMPKCFGVGVGAVAEFAKTGWATVQERKR